MYEGEEEAIYNDTPSYDFLDKNGDVVGGIYFSQSKDFLLETKSQFHIIAENNVGELYNVFSISPDPRSGYAHAQLEGSLTATERVVVGTEMTSPIVLTGWVEFYRGFSIEEDGNNLAIEKDGKRYLRLGSDAAGMFFQSEAIFNRTTSANPNVTIVENDNTLRRSTSAKKYKEDIQPIDVDPLKILELTPVSWVDKAELAEGNYQRRYHGLIADEVDAVGLGDYVTYENDEVDALMYDRLWTLLIPVIKDLKQESEQLRKDLETTNKIASDALIRVEKLEEKINENQKWTN